MLKGFIEAKTGKHIAELSYLIFLTVSTVIAEVLIE